MYLEHLFQSLPGLMTFSQCSSAVGIVNECEKFSNLDFQVAGRFSNCNSFDILRIKTH